MCTINNTPGCLNGQVNLTLNNLSNTTNFSANMKFFQSFKDAKGNPIFNESDVVGFFSMHSVGGVNNCTGNGQVNDPPWCSNTSRNTGAFFDATPGV